MYNDLEAMFDWDDANVQHIARHAISPQDAEHVLLHDPVDGGSQNHEGEQRYIQIGMTARFRVLVVNIT